MAGVSAHIDVDFSGLPRIKAAFGQILEDAADEAATTIRDSARQNAPQREGDLRENIRVFETDTGFDAGASRFRRTASPGVGRFVSATTAVQRTVGSDLVYAAAQEYGGTWEVPVTDRSRRFFWAMYAETGDEKWKWMALSQKASFTITLDAQPYLTPAVHAHRDLFRSLVKRRLA